MSNGWKGVSYKISGNRPAMVYKRETLERDYWSCLVETLKRDGTTRRYYRPIKFVQCEPPENSTRIRIKKGFEELRENPKDPYNPITAIVIMDYEDLSKPQENAENQAYEEFNFAINDNDLPF